MIQLREIIKEIKNSKLMFIEMIDAMPPSSLTIQSPSHFDPSFISYIKSIENPNKVGYKNGTWHPHKSPEGGLPTIAYGHKIKSQQELKQMESGISDENASKLLLSDLSEAKRNVYKYIKNKYGITIVLNPKQEEMLTEFSFNLGGLEKFPKFVDAVLRGQVDKMKSEYKRFYKTPSGTTKELSTRNLKFYNRYLK